jgi:hypothetical protein
VRCDAGPCAARLRIAARLDQRKGRPSRWLEGRRWRCLRALGRLRPRLQVYYAQDGVTLILLLCGGIKRTPDKDFEKADAYWKDYKALSG